MSSDPHKAVIFLADDDSDFRETLQRALEEDGYLVLPARTGIEALARMHGLSGLAIAIIDLKMPEMGGQRLITMMRADKALAAIPILAVSAHSDGPVKGADRFLRKPFHLKDLMRTIHELLLQAVPEAAKANSSVLSDRHR